MDIVQKQDFAFGFSYAVFSLLSTSGDLVMQTLVWLHMVLFRAVWCGMAQFITSCVNLRQPHIFKHQI
jgi:hypothetical protein